jgi:hypothetical protein
MFASVPAVGGDTCCQLYVGNTSSFTAIYGMKREGEGLSSLQQFVTDWGAPDCIRRDNSQMQNSEGWKSFERKMQIKSETSEAHNQQMNPAERRIQTIKSGTNQLMDRTNTPKNMWLECMIYYSSILNMICLERLGGRNAYEVAFGHSIDISPFIQFEWWEPVYYLDSEDPSFPSSKEKYGRFCGVSDNCGDLLTFKIYVQETKQIIHCSVLRSALNDKTPNQRALNPNYDREELLDDEQSYEFVDFDSLDDAKEPTLEHTKPILISREDMSERDPKLVDSTSSTDIPDPTDLIGFTFPVEHKGNVERATVIKKDENKNGYLVELLSGKVKLVEYNLLLDKYNEAADVVDEIYTFSDILNHKKHKQKWYVMVKWDARGMEPSWEPLSVIKQDDPITCAIYAKNNKLLNTPGWKWAKRVKDISPARLIRLSRRICAASRSNIKFQFGVQVPHSHRQALEIDRKNGNNLWKEAINKEISQLLEFETFSILPRDEIPPQDHQKIPMIMTFAVKHDGR